MLRAFFHTWIQEGDWEMETREEKEIWWNANNKQVNGRLMLRVGFESISMRKVSMTQGRKEKKQSTIKTVCI